MLFLFYMFLKTSKKDKLIEVPDLLKSLTQKSTQKYFQYGFETN